MNEIIGTDANELELIHDDSALYESLREFLVTKYPNENTRGAYVRALQHFMQWWKGAPIQEIRAEDIAEWRDLQIASGKSPASIKQRISALRMLFGHLVETGHLRTNPAANVRPPKLVREKGATPVLSRDEARRLLDAIDLGKPSGVRDRAFLSMLLYTWQRVSEVCALTMEDLFIEEGARKVRFMSKGNREHVVPMHRSLIPEIDRYLELRGDDDGHVFFSICSQTGVLTRRTFARRRALAMVKRRANRAGIKTPGICCHTMRATAITNFIRAGGTLEVAARIAAHKDVSTTALYARVDPDLELSEIERNNI